MNLETDFAFEPLPAVEDAQQHPFASIDDPLGPLAALPGTWVGTGFNTIWRPHFPSGAQDRFLDALYIGQAISTDPQQRAKMVRDFERHALTEAYAVPILWWDRIVVTSSSLKGWNMTPSHYIGQDLTDVWLEK